MSGSVIFFSNPTIALFLGRMPLFFTPVNFCFVIRKKCVFPLCLNTFFPKCRKKVVQQVLTISMVCYGLFLKTKQVSQQQDQYSKLYKYLDLKLSLFLFSMLYEDLLYNYTSGYNKYFLLFSIKLLLRCCIFFTTQF